MSEPTEQLNKDVAMYAKACSYLHDLLDSNYGSDDPPADPPAES